MKKNLLNLREKKLPHRFSRLADNDEFKRVLNIYRNRFC